MVLLISLFIAILGAYSGKEGTSLAWRRIGIPLVFLVMATLLGYGNAAWWVLLIIPVLSMGYGIPDETDKGSFLGRLYCGIFKEKKAKICDAYVRGTVAVLAAIPFIIISQNEYSVFGLPVLTFIWVLFGGDSFVENEGKVRGFLIEDLILYFAYGLYGMLALKGGINGV